MPLSQVLPAVNEEAQTAKLHLLGLTALLVALVVRGSVSGHDDFDGGGHGDDAG